MLIYCKHLNHKIYDYIRSSIKKVYRIDTMYTEDIIMNAVPVKYKDSYWIMCNLAGLEISSLDSAQKQCEVKYEIKYVVDEEINGTILINKVYSLHELYLNSDIEMNDCLYDEHLNIMFVKFQDIRIKYLDINECKFLKFDEFDKQNINLSWINNLVKKQTIVSSNNKIIFENKFLSLPSIPYIVSTVNNTEELNERPMLNYPCSGATVFNDAGEFLGMVCYVSKTQIVTIPTNLIKRSLDYMDGKVLYKFNFELLPVKILLKNALDIEIVEYGLYYNKNVSKHGQEMYNVVLSIDDYPISSNGNLLINDYSVPVSTYIWLFKQEDTLKMKGISSNILKNVCINKEGKNMLIDCRRIENIRFNHYNVKLRDESESVLPVSKLNFIKYNNKYLIEINEKIMQILKILIQSTDNYDELYDYINENLFSNKKIVVVIDNNVNIKIIKKIKKSTVYNLDTITKHYKKQHTLKNYIKSI